MAGIGEWPDLRTKWDEIGLRTEGDVKERVEALVNEWPELANAAGNAGPSHDGSQSRRNAAREIL